MLGSAILGVVAIGAYGDVPAAIRAMTRIDHRLEPRPEFAATYDRLFAAYTALYPAVAPIMRPLTAARSDVDAPVIEAAVVAVAGAPDR